MTSNSRPKTTIKLDGAIFAIDDRLAAQTLALETHSTPWRPAGAKLARLVDIAMHGISGLSRSEMAASIQSISALSYLYHETIAAGLRDVAIANATRMVVQVEQLAAAGSEDAAASLLILADLLQRDGVADDVFSAVRHQVGGQTA